MPDGFIHIVAGDLELLAARAEMLEDALRGLDVEGALARVGTAMPGSLSSAAAAAATAGLREVTGALGSRYAAIGSGTTELASAHRSNDEAMAELTPRAASGSASQWAIEKGLA